MVGDVMVKFFLLALLFAAPAGAADNLTFTQAKATADRDEASLSSAQSQALIQAQAPVVSKALSSCLGGGDAKPTPFTVVVELDSKGAVARSWRSDETRLAKCFQAVTESATLIQPPQSPFYSSFEMDLSASHGGQ